MKLYVVCYRTEDQDDEHRIWFKRKDNAKKYFDHVWRQIDEGSIAYVDGVRMDAFDFPLDKDGVLEILNWDQEDGLVDAETGQEERRIEASTLYQSELRIY
jgi:hypothetical protein